MVHPLLLFIGAITVAELYRRYATNEEKNALESKVKAHHGEVGILAALLGGLTGHLGVAATGLGLALHDIDDMPKWFTGNKNNSF